jgi:hypothetical protein
MQKFTIFRISTRETLCIFSAKDLWEACHLMNKWYGEDALDVDIDYWRVEDESR